MTSARRASLRRLLRDRRAVVGAAVLLAALLVAILAPLLAPYDPSAQLDIVRLRSAAPSLAHPFGTDPYSRDVLSRMIYGTRISLTVAFVAVTLSVSLGVVIGALAGYAGGVTDAVLMRVVDAAISVPRLLLLIIVVTLWGDVGVPGLTLLLAGTGWFSVSRIVRAEALVVREQDYVTAARALGGRPGRILLRHVLPNAAGPGLVAATLAIGNVILLEAGLSYLGIGIRPPAASWGSLIQDGAERVSDLWWLTLLPGLAILITVFACNALGDALRDLLDPRQLAGQPAADAVHQTRRDR